MPDLEGLSGLDPQAAELIRRTAAELEAGLDRPERWTQLGVVLHAHSRFQVARECYEQALLRDDEDARAWYWLAVVEDELGATDAAIASLERAIQVEPRYPPAHWRLGALRLGLGQLEQADAALQAARALAPHDAAAVVGLARVRLQQGAFAEAAVLLEDHLRRLPADANARYLIGTAYQGLGRTEEAAEALAGASGAQPLQQDPWLQEVLSQRQGYRADFLRAVEALDRDQLEPAVALLEELRARKPDDTLVLISLHRAYRKQGELERAIDLLVEARRIDPLLDVVHFHLAGAYRDRAHRAKGTERDAPDPAWLASALASSEVACELGPTFAAAHGMRGDVLSDLGRAEAAAEAYTRAAELDQNSARWQEKAGASLCRLGRWDAAVPFLRQLDALEPRSARVLLHLAAALANSGHAAEARAPLEQARFLAPEDPVIRKAVEDLERTLAGGNGG